MTLETWIEDRKASVKRAIAASNPPSGNKVAHDMLLMLRMIEAALEGFDQIGRNGRLAAFCVKQAMQRVLDESEKTK